MKRAAICLSLFVALGGAAAAPAATAEQEARLQGLLHGATPGRPSDCLPQQPRLESRNVPGIGILYGRGRNLWLDRFEGGCPSLGRNEAIVTVTPDRVCRGDIARIVEPVSRIEHGSCIFGQFTPYTAAR